MEQCELLHPIGSIRWIQGFMNWPRAWEMGILRTHQYQGHLSAEITLIIFYDSRAWLRNHLHTPLLRRICPVYLSCIPWQGSTPSIQLDHMVHIRSNQSRHTPPGKWFRMVNHSYDRTYSRTLYMTHMWLAYATQDQAFTV